MKANDLGFYRDWVDHEKGRRLYVWLYYCFPELPNGTSIVFPVSVPTIGPAVQDVCPRRHSWGVFQ